MRPRVIITTVIFSDFLNCATDNTFLFPPSSDEELQQKHMRINEALLRYMPFLWVLDFTRSLNHMQPSSLWHPKALSDRWLAPPGPMVWTRCCDDKTLLAAIREQREQSSISLSSNPRSSIDFPRMRNGRQERAQSDIPMGPVCVCVRVQYVWENANTRWIPW